MLMDEQKPGDVVAPSSDKNAAEEPSANLAQDSASAATPENKPATQTPNDLAGNPSAKPAPNTEMAQPSPVLSDSPNNEEAPTLAELESKFGYKPGSSSDAESAPQPSTPAPAVSWTASEFIHHAKSANWYLILTIVGVIAAIGVYLITKDILSTVVIAIVAILFGVSASSRPRALPYEVNASGVQIGPKHYDFGQFKTFSVVRDGGPFSSVQLMPLKRFAPPISIYFPPDEEKSIINALSGYLPYEERKADATDKLLRKLRF